MAEQVGKFLTELPELTSPSDSNLMYVVDGDTSKKATLGNLKKIVGGDVTGAGSGVVVSFSDGADDAPLETLGVEIDPIQDLHGYSKPWAGGAGKNKAPFFTDITTGVVTMAVGNDGVCTLNGNSGSSSSLLVNNPITLEAGTYTLSDGVSEHKAQLQIYNMTTSNVYWIDTTQTFTYNGTDNINIRLWIAGNTSFSDYKIYPMVRISTTSADYEPYANICPISGHSSIDISVMGKNLVNELHNGAISSVGGYTTPSTRVSNATSATSSKIKVTSGKYTISGDGLAYATVLTKDNEGNIVDNFAGSWNEMPYTFTITQTANLYFTCRKSDGSVSINPSDVKVQIEEGSEATSYEQYINNTTEVDLGRTAYGGTLNVKTGELIIDHVVVNMGSLNWIRTTDYNNPLFYAQISDKKNSSIDAICEWYANGGLITGTTALNNIQNGYFGCGNNSNFIYVRDDQFTTVSDFKTATSSVKFYYELSAPQTYSLTPTEVRTLLGNNNVSADSGNVDLVYVRDLNIVINDLIDRVTALENE